MYTSSRFLLNTFILSIIITLASCTARGPASFFGKKSPHDAYSDKITDAGLKETAMGRSWFAAAEQSIGKALSITIPYSETGYFAAERPEAVGVKFKAKRGEKLVINLTKKPISGFAIYMDLWEATTNNTKPKLLVSADTTKSSLVYEVTKDESLVVRLQPELLVSGEYTMSISTGPTLAFPVPMKARPTIGSFWGANRDNGERRHEGIDIFAPFRTPLVAAADGRINRVEENKLGGKVIFLSPYNKDYTLYYAHLDKQLATPGQEVKIGDTIGLMGKTGNAATTAPHLHFGIYTYSGAIDPLAFVNPIEKKPSPINVSLSNINKWVRSVDKTGKVYGEPIISSSNSVTDEGNSLLRVQSATAGWYKVVLPDGRQGYIQGGSVTSINKPLEKFNSTSALALLKAPATDAPKITTIEKGEAVNVLAQFKDFYYVSAKETEGWLPKAGVTAR